MWSFIHCVSVLASFSSHLAGSNKLGLIKPIFSTIVIWFLEAKQNLYNSREFHQTRWSWLAGWWRVRELPATSYHSTMVYSQKVDSGSKWKRCRYFVQNWGWYKKFVWAVVKLDLRGRGVVVRCSSRKQTDVLHAELCLKVLDRNERHFSTG